MQPFIIFVAAAAISVPALSIKEDPELSAHLPRKAESLTEIWQFRDGALFHDYTLEFAGADVARVAAFLRKRGGHVTYENTDKRRLNIEGPAFALVSGGDDATLVAWYRHPAALMKKTIAGTSRLAAFAQIIAIFGEPLQLEISRFEDQKLTIDLACAVPKNGLDAAARWLAQHGFTGDWKSGWERETPRARVDLRERTGLERIVLRLEP